MIVCKHVEKIKLKLTFICFFDFRVVDIYTKRNSIYCAVFVLLTQKKIFANHIKFQYLLSANYIVFNIHVYRSAFCLFCNVDRCSYTAQQHIEYDEWNSINSILVGKIAFFCYSLQKMLVNIKFAF